MINDTINGVERCVIYPIAAPAVPWEGVVSIKEASQDAGVNEFYIDGKKYSNSFTRIGVNVSIEAYTYPDELDNDAPIRLRGLTWRNNKMDAYETHILYNLVLKQDVRNYQTINKDSQLTLFSWDGISKPSFSTTLLATSHLVIMSDKANSGVTELIENLLYGTRLTPPILPTFDEVVSIFENEAVFLVIDHGDGTWTAIGPDDWIEIPNADEFLIRTPSAYFISEEKYKLRSW